MNFCPECGSVLSESEKFCPNCGAKLSLDSMQSEIVDDAIEDSESAKVPTQEELETKYAENLAYAKDKHVCAFDGEKLKGFGNQLFELADGYFICVDHFHHVYNGYPEKNDTLPTLVEFLELYNDPDHVPDLLPSQRKRIDDMMASDNSTKKAAGKFMNAMNSLAASAPAPKKKIKHAKGAIFCPYCDSENVTFMQNKRKGFSLGKAVAGGVLTGGIGTVAGFAGKKGKNQFICNDCNRTFEHK